LAVLEDPQQRIPPYDAIVLVSPKRAGDERFLSVLRSLTGAISVRTMRQANFTVDRPEGAVSPAAASRWLDETIAAPASR
jgi:osmoprotectant transport system permease protein